MATLFLVNGMLFATWVSRIPAIETARRLTHAELGVELNPDSPRTIDKAPSILRPRRSLLALAAIAFCVMMGEGAMADWSAIYLRQIIFTSEGLAAAGYAAFSIAMASGRFFGDRLAAHFGPDTLVRGSAVVAFLGLVLLLSTPYPLLALIGFAGVGLGFAPIVPMVFSATGHLPGVNPGLALASVTTLGYVGWLLGPPVIGFTAGLIGLRAALSLLLAGTLLIAFLATAVRPSK